MSVQAMAWVLEHSEAKLADRLVLLAIANHADAEGRNAWPAQKKIAEEARVSVRTVKRSIEKLSEMGELVVVLHGGAVVGYGRTNYYVLPMGQGANLAPSEQGDIHDSKGTSTTSKGPTVAPQEPSEPSVEPSRDLSREPTLSSFDSIWPLYPRKLNRKGALKAFTARVKAGANTEDLLQATLNYAAAREGEDPAFTMHGATFFGPNERWQDWLDPVPEETAGPRPRENRHDQKSRRLLQLLNQQPSISA